MQMEYPISDLARIFPEMTPEDFARLVASIREDGLMDPITVWRGRVIDGRHRYAACAEAGGERRFEYLDDDADPCGISSPGTTCGAIWTKEGGPSSPTSSRRRRPPDGLERKTAQICTVPLPRGKRPRGIVGLDLGMSKLELQHGGACIHQR